MAASPGSSQTRRTTRSTASKADEDSSFSYFEKTVSLYDWWLIRADEDFQGKRLAVAGVSSKEQRPMRVFRSAPIAKVLDVFTLVTSDGIAVILQGLMNKTRTLENGFPLEVCRHFLFGFPPHWEEYGKNFSEQAVNSGINLLEDFNHAGVAHQGQQSMSPTVGDSLKSSANLSEDTAVFYLMQPGAEANIGIPSVVEGDTVRATPNTSGPKSSSKPLRSLRGYRRDKPVSRCSLKQKDNELMSDGKCINGKRPKKSLNTTVNSPGQVNIPEAMKKAAKRLMSQSGYSESKYTDEETADTEGGSSSKGTRRKIIFDHNVSCFLF
uniref:Uncharacterized protein LOC107431105 isoform X2 n=1 Tax=Rhizophora mucronata TaxID=61149 RepID=A0A2P2JBC9_RHIMU